VERYLKQIQSVHTKWEIIKTFHEGARRMMDTIIYSAALLAKKWLDGHKGEPMENFFRYMLNGGKKELVLFVLSKVAVCINDEAKCVQVREDAVAFVTTSYESSFPIIFAIVKLGD